MSSVDRIKCLRSQGKRDRQMDGLEINAKRRIFEKRTLCSKSQGGQIDASVVDHNVFWRFSAVFGSSAQLLTDIWIYGWTDGQTLL